MAALLLKQAVDLGKQACKRLAIGEQVAIVVDEDRHLKKLFEHGLEGYATLEVGKVLEVANDAIGIIGRARKTKTDGRRFTTRFFLCQSEALHNLSQYFIECFARSRNGKRLDNLLGIPHGRKFKSGSTGIEYKNGVFIRYQHDVQVLSRKYRIFGRIAKIVIRSLFQAKLSSNCCLIKTVLRANNKAVIKHKTAAMAMVYGTPISPETEPNNKLPSGVNPKNDML